METAEMTTMLDRYVDLLRDIKRRHYYVASLVEKAEPSSDRELIAESAALQLRKILELVAFSTLIPNEKLWRANKPELAKLWRGKKVLGAVKRLNPTCYPKPSLDVELPPGGLAPIQWVDLPSGTYLDERKWVSSFDFTGNVLHAPNPFGDKKPDSEEILSRVVRDLGLLVSLLDRHHAHLDTDFQIFATMQSKKTGEPTATMFGTVGPA